MTHAEAERLILEAQKHGDLLGVRLSVADDNGPDRRTLPPSRRRVEKPLEGPLPETVRTVAAIGFANAAHSMSVILVALSNRPASIPKLAAKASDSICIICFRAINGNRHTCRSRCPASICYRHDINT